MQTETLTQIKQRIVSLDKFEKQDLADFLAKEINENNNAEISMSASDDKARHSQLEWLKANREKYAGKYVALADDQLVGEGETIREAREQALKNGFRNAFLTRVYSETEIPFAGW